MTVAVPKAAPHDISSSQTPDELVLREVDQLLPQFLPVNVPLKVVPDGKLETFVTYIL